MDVNTEPTSSWQLRHLWLRLLLRTRHPCKSTRLWRLQQEELRISLLCPIDNCIGLFIHSYLLQFFLLLFFFLRADKLQLQVKGQASSKRLALNMILTLHYVNLLWNELQGSFQGTIRKSLISGFQYIHHRRNDWSLWQSGHKSHKNLRHFWGISSQTTTTKKLTARGINYRGKKGLAKYL